MVALFLGKAVNDRYLMNGNMIIPQYGQASLSDVMSSVAARLTGFARPAISLPKSDKYVVLLVDALGWNVLKRYREHAEFLAKLQDTAQKITCGVPSTTVASITSLGTGCVPGTHGMVGYRFREPYSREIMNALTWEGGPRDLAGFQPNATVFEQLRNSNFTSATVCLSFFENSGLTRCGLRGSTFVGINPEDSIAQRVKTIKEASAEYDLVYCYEGELDHEGHRFGVGSHQWFESLNFVDDLTAELCKQLPESTCFIITGDHGMINGDPRRQIIVEEHHELLGYDLLAGEARFRHLYTSDAAGLAKSWASFLGDKAWVRTKEEAIAEGWFGTVTSHVMPRIGDVVVAMKDNWALMSLDYEIELSLIGMHGSLTPDEMFVPLLISGI